MTVIEGIDYSYSRPTPAQIKSAGKHFVVRYITTPGSGNKGISAAEFKSLHDAGIAVVVVYEGSASGMKKGKAQGVIDAKDAEKNLKAIVGLNDNLPVYFACDWDATPGDQTAINAYLDGAASVLGRNRVGIYGGYYPVKRAHDAGKATWLWQTYGWSGGQILDGIHLYQYQNDVKLGGNGAAVDYVRAYKTEYGQHGVAAPTPAPAPKPVPVPAEVPTPVVIVPKAPEPTPVPVVEPAPVTATVPKHSADEVAADEEAAAEANAKLDKSNFHGVYYFKGTGAADIFAYDPATGRKRHVLAAEWQIVKAFGHDEVVLLAQDDADAIPASA